MVAWLLVLLCTLCQWPAADDGQFETLELREGQPGPRCAQADVQCA